MRTPRWVQGGDGGGEHIPRQPGYAAAKCDAMTQRPDYRQLVRYTLSMVMLTTLTILLIVSFP